MDTSTITGRNPLRVKRSGAFTIDPIFRCQLAGYDIRLLGASRDTIYLIDAALCIRGYNAEYIRYARRNGGRDLVQRYGLGAAVLEGSMTFYAAHYRDVFRACLDERRPRSHVYFGSSPRALGRYRETIEPLGRGDGLLVSHRLLESTVRSEAKSFDPFVHLSEDGLILRCCHCQRVRNHRMKGRWDWLPDEAKESRYETSHGICPECLNTYYPVLETVEF